MPKKKAQQKKQESVAVRVYFDPRTHRAMKAKAATHGMTLSDYLFARIFSGTEIVTKGDFIPAPAAPAAPAGAPETYSESMEKLTK